MTEPETLAEVNFDAAYVRATGLHSVEIDGETVVYVESTESLHLLDPTASIVWDALAADVTLAALCDDLAEAFGVGIEQIRADVAPLVSNLTEAGLLMADSNS
jgi:hypothetical protein